MADFFDWVKDNKLDIGEIDENRIRTGIKFGYPDAYVAAQYPPSYYPSHTATAPFDLQTRKQAPSKAAPAGTPG